MTGAIPSALWDDGPLQDADVPLAQIEASIEQLATQLAHADAFSVPYLRAEYALSLHRDGHEGAQHAFAEWSAAVAGRDAADSAPIASAAAAVTGALPWCPHCDHADQVEHLVLTGHYTPAVEAAGRLLRAAPGTLCHEQPTGVISAVLPALLLTGQAELAASRHLLASRLLDQHDAGARFTRARAWQLLTCARAGRLRHALDLLQDWFSWLPDTTPAYARLHLLAAGARVLRDVSEAGHGDLLMDLTLPLDLPPSLDLVQEIGPEVTVDDVGARLLREARDLAARFDVRNQTQTATALVDEILDAPDLPELPLDAVLRSPRSSPVPGRRVTAPPRGGRRTRAEQERLGAKQPGTSPPELVAEFDAALSADSQPGRDAVIATWTAIRSQHELDVGTQAQDPARLDGWTAIENLNAAGDLASSVRLGLAVGLIEQADAATRRLRMAGLPLESLLHEQAALYAAAQSGVTPASVVQPRIEAIAGEIAELDRPADLGLAYSRVALIQELAAMTPAPPVEPARRVIDLTALPADQPDSEPVAEPGSEVAPVDAVKLGLAALESVPVADLNHQQARALCRLLRLHAGQDGPETVIEHLERAIAVLPDGVRPIERALARSDLASLLQETDPVAAHNVWRRAVSDARLAGAESLFASVLAAGAMARQASGDVDGAIADLTEAVPILDQSSAPELAAQARFDLGRALMEARRFVEAASAAESALADLTDLMTAPAQSATGWPGSLAEDPGLAHVAGCAAFTAAEAVAALGDDVQGRALAELSAGWHEANGNLVAEAEAWQLAARIGGPPRRVASDLERAAELAEAGGEWSRAALCRRDRATVVRVADGVDAALEVLDEAEKALNSREAAGGRHVSKQEAQAASRMLAWHRMALSEQRARMLAVAGRFGEALTAVDGLEDGYTALGDDWSARDLLGLRGQLRAELHDLPGALADLERAAQAALDAGDRDQARGLGERLAMVLDQAGRTWDAEQAYQRFTT